MDLFGKRKNHIETTTLLLEPLGTMLTNWQLARVLGCKESKARIILQAYQQSHLAPNNLLGQILGKTKIKDKSVHSIHSSPLLLLGERRSFELGSRAWQFIVGLPSEVREYFTDAQVEDDCSKAMENGFLPLIVLESAAKGAAAKYSYVGTLLFEPKFTDFEKEDWRIRLLSVLPSEFLAYFAPKTGITKPNMDARALLHMAPHEIEEAIKDFWAIGSANLRDRYQLITLLKARGYVDSYLSKNPEDEDLIR